ncbi:prepilin peptidase [Sphingopyxis sp. CCNWLW253]|uniref:prepilin peptidase n=1 Tax=unclassified Sphingopyxis TaxID=2614943 RepID=UPI003012BB73
MIEAAYVVILALAAYSDARRFIIPNIYPLLLLLLGGIASFAGFPFAAPLWSHLLHFAIALGAGMLLFHLGWFGGGDVKLYAAVSLWFALSNGLFLLLVVSLSGVAVVLLSIVLRLGLTAFGRADRTKGSFMKRRIAYGLAIGGGGIASMLLVYP